MAFFNQQNQNRKSELVNNILQSANNQCLVSCANYSSGNVYEIIGNKGLVDVTQSCVISDASCVFRTSFENDITNLIETISTQKNKRTTMGFSFELGQSSQNIDIKTYIENNISQIMNSSCSFVTQNVKSNNYYLVRDNEGQVHLGQEGSITTANCTIENFANNTIYNEDVAELTQENVTENIFGLIAIAIICVIAVIIIIVIIFIFKGTGTVNKTIDKADDISKNPQLMNTLMYYMMYNQQKQVQQQQQKQIQVQVQQQQQYNQPVTPTIIPTQ